MYSRYACVVGPVGVLWPLDEVDLAVRPYPDVIGVLGRGYPGTLRQSVVAVVGVRHTN